MPFPLAYRVSVEKSADSLMGVPLYVICCFSLVAYNIFSLSLIFVSLITMCLGVRHLLEFIFPGTLCASWTWLTISFPMFRKFLAIISSNIFLSPFSLPSPSGTLVMQMFVCLIVLRLSRGLVVCLHLFSFFFLYSILQQ